VDCPLAGSNSKTRRKGGRNVSKKIPLQGMQEREHAKDMLSVQELYWKEGRENLRATKARKFFFPYDEQGGVLFWVKNRFPVSSCGLIFC